MKDPCSHSDPFLIYFNLIACVLPLLSNGRQDLFWEKMKNKIETETQFENLLFTLQIIKLLKRVWDRSGTQKTQIC